jgi:hypothetical protein
MIWNPTTTGRNNATGEAIWGGKHAIYITNFKYDAYYGGTDTVKKLLKVAESLGPIVNNPRKRDLYRNIMWVGNVLKTFGVNLLPIKDGIIPTTTTVKMRVRKPYSRYIHLNHTPSTLRNFGFPLYSFSTKGLAPSVNDKNTSVNALDLIRIVPNPYYAYSGYEANRLDNKVKFTNLPKKCDITIFSLDGTLIRRLTKDDALRTYLDWDLKNAKSVPIASGMYLIHVKSEGIGEVVLKWFGAMKPLDVSTF